MKTVIFTTHFINLWADNVRNGVDQLDALYDEFAEAQPADSPNGILKPGT